MKGDIMPWYFVSATYDKWVFAEDPSEAKEEFVTHIVMSEDPYGLLNIHIQEIERNDIYCPKCNSNVNFDEYKGKYYIYCPNCGPHLDLLRVVEINHEYYLGYPPKNYVKDEKQLSLGVTCPNCLAPMRININDHSYLAECYGCNSKVDAPNLETLREWLDY